MTTSFLRQVSQLARTIQPIYVKGQSILPVQAYLTSRVLSGSTEFYLPRSIYSSQSFDLQRNHLNMITWIESQGWNVDLRRQESRNCDNWQELDETKRNYHTVYATSIFVTLR